jgi:hypothetical protein
MSKKMQKKVLTRHAPARSRTEGAGFKVLSDNHYTTRAD